MKKWFANAIAVAVIAAAVMGAAGCGAQSSGSRAPATSESSADEGSMKFLEWYVNHVSLGDGSGGGGGFAFGGGGSGAGGGCAAGYDPCVPPYPPDVDCSDVDGPIKVTGSDPHGLDADGDGIGCEPYP